MSHFLASMGACNLILHIHVVVNCQLWKQGILWLVSHDCIAGSGVDPSQLRFFNFSADKLVVFNRLHAQLQVDLQWSFVNGSFSFSLG